MSVQLSSLRNNTRNERRGGIFLLESWRPEISWMICRFRVGPFDYWVKAGQSPTRPRPKTSKGDVMKYLVAIHHPDNYDPSKEDEAMGRDIDVLNEEMEAAGVRIFAGGLRPAT